MPKLPLSKDSATITSQSVVLVEGNDEIGFFEALIKSMGLTLGTDIQVWSVNGKDNYRNEFAAFLLTPGFENVKSYGLTLGVAAGRGYWNFESAALDDIRNFIRNLSSIDNK